MLWRWPSGRSSDFGTGGGLTIPTRARGGERQPRLLPAFERWRLPVGEQVEHGVDVVDVERAGDVGAADAELAGGAQRVRERGLRARA